MHLLLCTSLWGRAVAGRARDTFGTSGRDVILAERREGGFRSKLWSERPASLGSRLGPGSWSTSKALKPGTPGDGTQVELASFS